MNANELADGIESCTTDPLHKKAATMLRILDKQLAFRIDAVTKYQEKVEKQQTEIDFLKKEILAKHEDWKHEGQQAANARAEIEALTKESLATLRQQQAEIEALKAKDFKKSMAIRSLNTQLKKALQYETFNR